LGTARGQEVVPRFFEAALEFVHYRRGAFLRVAGLPERFSRSGVLPVRGLEGGLKRPYA